MYYTLLGISALLFSFVFIFSDRYRAKYGSGIDAVLKFTAGSHFAGLAALLIINRFHFEFTGFTCALACVAAADSILFSIFSLRALEKANLSVYSVLSMIGGMALPFAAGILFFSEDLTAGKAICFALVTASVLLTVKKGAGKGSLLLYAGVFITNGLYGVISKFFTASSMPKTSEAAYSAMIEGFIVIFSLILLAAVKKKKSPVKTGPSAFVYMGGYGVMCAAGNYLLLIALSVLSASAQYPFVTGGVMIISTVYSFFTPSKPCKREIISVLLSLAGIAALTLL